MTNFRVFDTNQGGEFCFNLSKNTENSVKPSKFTVCKNLSFKKKFKIVPTKWRRGLLFIM